MKLFSSWLTALKWRRFIHQEGLWRDPDPCPTCGMRVFYVIPADGEMQLQCATCRK